MPYAFTEHGTLMLANVLNSPRAVLASIQVIRAFVKMREMLVSNTEFARKLDSLEKKVKTHGGDIKVIFAAIHTLQHPVTKKHRKIGFDPGGKQ